MNKLQEDSQSTPLPGVLQGRIERLENFKSVYVSPRHIDVWLPEGYPSNGEYAVLYMSDGQMLFDNLPVAYREFLKQAKRVDGTLIFAINIRSDDYLKFITEELKPFIDRRYATLTNVESTFIAGSSMGGLISIYAVCEYPEVFGGAACLSTHWTGIYTDQNNPIPDVLIEYLQQNLPSPAYQRIYFDYGTETLDALYEPYQLRVDQIMMNKGYRSANWQTRKFMGEEHSEEAWRKRLHISIPFLLHS